MIELFTVSDRFQTRGAVGFSCLVRPLKKVFSRPPGDAMQLRTPDGRVIAMHLLAKVIDLCSTLIRVVMP